MSQRKDARLRAAKKKAERERKRQAQLYMNEPNQSAIKKSAKSQETCSDQRANGGGSGHEILEAFFGGLLSTLGALIQSDFPKSGTAVIGLGLLGIIHGLKRKCDSAWRKPKLVGALAWVLWSTVTLITAHMVITRYQREREQVDLLVPANDPMPSADSLGFGMLGSDPISTLDSNGVMVIKFGGNLLATTKTNPLPIIRFNGTNLLNLWAAEPGASISGQFRSREGRIVALLETNRFALGGEAFDPRRPDKHTLVVKDQENIEVLRIRYMNKRAFSITGLIRTPDGGEISIGEKLVTVNTPEISGVEFSGFLFNNVTTCFEIEGTNWFLGRRPSN